jgi:hypothetical protein
MSLEKFLTYAGLRHPVIGAPSQDQVNSAVDSYLTRHPVEPGATETEAAQIEANRVAIEGKQDKGNYVKSVNGATPDANGNVVVATGGGSGSGQNPAQGGLTAEQVNALYGMLRVAAYDPDSDYAGAHVAFCAAFGLATPDDGGGSEGGDTGGDNTGGSGGEDSGGNDGDVSNEVKWTDGVAYTFEPVQNEYVETNGAFTSYNGWNRTPYLHCKGAKVLRVVINDATSILGMNNQYNAFYDEAKNFVGAFNYTGIDNNTAGAYKDIEIPADAAYFVASHKAGAIGTAMVASNALGFVPYSEVPV